MEYTTSSGVLAMPAHYALVPQEEMVYLEGGAFSITPEQVIQCIKDSGLRGRGGGGFPTGRVMKDFFSSLNSAQWVMLGVTGLLGGMYGLSLASYYYTQLVDPLVKAFQEAFAMTAAQAEAQGQLPAAA